MGGSPLKPEFQFEEVTDQGRILMKISHSVIFFEIFDQQLPLELPWILRFFF